MNEQRLEALLLEAWQDGTDAAHDIDHVKRVVVLAKRIGEVEGADVDVVLAAAWLHDCVCLPKNHPERKQASVMAGEKAKEMLAEENFPAEKLDAVAHAIAAHSFSANIAPESLEAKIVQDADRLDALGAVGIARTFAVSGQLGRPLFDSDDLKAENRPLDDTVYGVDYFYVKLFKIVETLNTYTAAAIAKERVAYMEGFIAELEHEISGRG